MGRHYHYIPGSFYRVDDITGFPQRAERTRRQWDNLIVADPIFDHRQPQDLVKGVKDDQSVPYPRPLADDTFVGPIYVSTTANAAVRATTIALASVNGFQAGSQVSVMMDNGVEFRTTVTINPPALTITLAAPLPYKAASGNLVTLYRANPGVGG